MAVSLAELTQKLADLKASVDALVAAATPTDLQAAADQVDALKAEADAAVAAAVPAGLGIATAPPAA